MLPASDSFTTIMSLAGRSGRVLQQGRLTYITLSCLELQREAGGLAYWNYQPEGDRKQPPNYEVCINWYGQAVTYRVFGKSESAALNAACYLLAKDCGRVISGVVKAVRVKQSYTIRSLLG